MRRHRNTKIIATLGPATSDLEQIRALFLAGADVFRLNFSHGHWDDHKKRYEAIRHLEHEVGRPIAILMDLQGPKLRIGKFLNGKIELKTGDRLILDTQDSPGDQHRVMFPHADIFHVLEVGHHLLVDDGKIRLMITDRRSDRLVTEVLQGGMLSDRKGVNIPNAIVPISPLTEKDHQDLSFGLELGVDWVAMSFVQQPDDVILGRKVIDQRAGLLAKLEKPSAIDFLDDIVEQSDALMIARGDLGVELPPEQVPGLQKKIIRSCRRAGRPVVVATQMLESMINSPIPTRAEASDVATAVYDGADAVMLSAETASGQFPTEAATMMDRIIRQVETDHFYRSIMNADHVMPEPTSADAITAAAAQVAHTIKVAAIVTFSTSGSTTLRASRERPEVPILGLTENLLIARRLALTWGVHNVHTSDIRSFEEMIKKACYIAKHEGFAIPGQAIAITAGIPFGTPGSTNILKIAWIRERD